MPKEIETLIFPILVDTKTNEVYYLNQNIFYNLWNDVSAKSFLIKYILLNEDIEDHFISKKNIR